MAISPSIRSGLKLAALNLLLCVCFALGTLGSVFGNRVLFERTGNMLPVIPIVVLLFILISLGAWFFAGWHLKSTGKQRILEAVLGSVPLLLGTVLAIVLLGFNMLLGNQAAAAVVMPIGITFVGLGAAACFVGMIAITGMKVFQPGVENSVAPSV